MIVAKTKRLAVALCPVTFVAGLGCQLMAAGSGQATGEDITWAPAPGSIVNPRFNRDKSGWEALKARSPVPSEDEHLEDPILRGAIDLHAHSGPDAYSRQWDAFEAARIGFARGMRGMVFKNHSTETAGLASMVRKYGEVPGFEAFGSVALNGPVGGINPQAVRYLAEVRGNVGKVVWLPTHDSETEVRHSNEIRPYVVSSRNGVLLPQLLEVLDLVAEYRLTLATGHIYPEEMMQVVAEARKRGIDRIIITHPGVMGPMYTHASVDQLKQVTAMGAYAEVVAAELTNERFRKTAIGLIRAIGPAHIVVSSDSGLTGWYNHADALVRAVRLLREAGFSEDDLDLMFRDNPAKVLGLPVL